MAIATIILAPLHLAQAAGSAYALCFSYVSITKLRTYEERTEKAAEWSETAGEQLRRTRTTQGGAGGALLLSLLTSILLLRATTTSSSPSSATGTWTRPSHGTQLLLSATNLLTTLVSRAHVRGFWAGSAKMPFAQDYNDALAATGIVSGALGVLGAAWGVSGVVRGLGLF